MGDFSRLKRKHLKLQRVKERKRMKEKEKEKVVHTHIVHHHEHHHHHIHHSTKHRPQSNGFFTARGDREVFFAESTREASRSRSKRRGRARKGHTKAASDMGAIVG